MEENVLGEILGTLRYKGNMTRIELCEGLCSTVTLMRIEEGTRVPDKFMMEVFFERLGIAQDKMEETILERDYYLQELRYEIGCHLAKREYGEVRKRLEKYRARRESKQTLHRQYLYRIEAILAKRQEKDKAKCIVYLNKAIDLTFKGTIDQIDEKRLLSEEEITILLMLTRESMRKDLENSLIKFRKLQIYMESNYKDPKIKAKIYPKVYYYLAMALMEKRYYKEMLEVCTKGINLLEHSGILFGLYQLLSLYEEGKKASGCEDEGKEIKRKLKVLRSLGEEYAFCDKRTELWERAIDEEVFLIHELIRKNRVTQRVSQESLAEAIDCEQKAISDMELASRGPNRLNYIRIKKYLNINQDYFRGFIISENMEDHYMRAEVSRLISVLDYVEAQKLFQQLRERLLLDKKENLQYILWMETKFKVIHHEIPPREALYNYYEALYITLPEFNEGEILVYILARKEVYILNDIAFMKSRLGKKNEAVNLLRSILQSYRESDVDMKYHIDGLRVTMLNLVLELQDENEMKEVNTICDDAIRLEMESGMGRFIGRFLAVKGYMAEKAAVEEKNLSYKKKACIYFKKALHISNIMQDFQTEEAIRIYCIRLKIS